MLTGLFFLQLWLQWVFGNNFIPWVKLLYTDVRSSVLVNGYTSRSFRPSRGVHQGCPLSPLLYVLSMEVLAASVRCHPDITGLRLPGSRFMAVSNKALVPSLILVNVRVFGWARGVAV